MEIWHRVSIDGKDVEYWRSRGLEMMKPIRSAFYDNGIAKAWVLDISESSELWPEGKARIQEMAGRRAFARPNRLTCAY